MIRRILLPAVLPAYVVALRVGLGLGWMFVVAAEFMGASEGPRLSPDRRPAARQARANRCRHRDLRHSRQDHRLADRIGGAPFLRWQDLRRTDRSGVMLASTRRKDLSERRPSAREHYFRRDGARRDRRYYRRLRLRQVTLLRPSPGSTARARALVSLDERRSARRSQDRHHLPGAAPAPLAQRRRQCRLRAGDLPAAEAPEGRGGARTGRPVRKGRCWPRELSGGRRSASRLPARW